MRLNAGNRERGGALRYGLAVGADGHLRLYAKAYDRSDTHRGDGSTVNDSSRGTQAGFRADWSGQRDSLTVQGDVYRGRVEQVPEERTFSGANILTRWNRSFENGGDASVQAYVERTKRDHPQSFGETLDTVDVVAQYGFRPAADHRVLLGAGYRHAHDDLRQFAALGFEPSSRSLTWRRLFAQDQITLSRELTATLATSVETNPYTGTEVLPSVRMAWHPSADTTWWGAVSRAVRAPSRIDREFVQPARPPYIIAGGPDFRSEVSNVLELGHRAQPDPSLSYSLTAYYHQHRHLRSLAPTPSGLQFQNGFEGWTRGLEAWARWRVTGRWQLEAGGNYLQHRLRLREGSVDVGGAQLLGNDPRQRWLLRSAFDFTPRHVWDVSLRRVGTLPNPNVPSYVAVDTRLAWSVAGGTELALQIQNVFDARHAESGTAANRVELERAFMVQLRWRH